MNITINKSDLKAAITDLKRIMVKYEARHVAILNDTLKIETGTDGIKLTVSDAKITLIKKVPGMIRNHGAALYPFKQLEKTVNKLKNDSLTFEGSSLKAGVHTFNYDTAVAAVDYPKVPHVGGAAFNIELEQFKELFDKVLYAVSNQESRPILTGINVKINNDTITAAATDSHRLASKTIELPTDKELECTIPGTLLKKAMKVKWMDQLKIVVSDTYIKMVDDNTTAFIRLLGGNYPELTRLVPTTFNSTVTVNKKTLIESVELASIIAKNEKNNVIYYDNGNITAGVKYTFVSELNVQREGEGIRIAFNPDYIMDALKHIESDTIELKFVSPLRPFLVAGAGDDRTHLVTPIRS